MCTDTPTHLPCSTCGEMLPLDQFHNSCTLPARYYKQYRCIPCTNEYVRQWRVENPLKRTIQSAKTRTRRKNIPEACDLDVAYLKPLDVDICPMLGIPMQWNIGTYYGKRIGTKTGGALWQQDNSKSLDRIHSTKGYVKGNVILISWRANKLKADATLEEMVKIGEWAKQQLLYETTD